ncbi:MAG: ABC transporter substrate-binding protein [Rhodospirillales bacterium]|nr:ABC transporter substrate-binding protein [Rhodospirillales bacterium]
MPRVLLRLAIVLTLCIPFAGIPAVAHAQPMKIVIGAAQADNHAPIFAGVEKGFFAAAGLDAKVVLYSTGVDMLNGQLNGAQQVSVLGTAPFLAGVANGFPLVMIATLHGSPLSDSYSENQAIVASASSGIKPGDLKSLAGKRIALPFGTDAQTYLVNLLGQAGIPASHVRLINAGPATLATALENGDADAISIWQPWGSATLANVKGSVPVIAGGCIDCFMPGTVLTSRKVIAGRKVLLQRFMLAFARAEQWVRQHNNAAAAIDTHWIQGVSLSILESSLHHSRFDPRISKLTIEGFAKKSIPQMLAAHEIRRRFNPAASIDAEFILAAERKAPQYFSDLPPIPAADRLAPPSGH